MDTNKPTTPTAEIAKTPPTLIEVAKAKIKNAWIAGLISVSITLVFVIISLTGTSIAGIDAWGFIDIGIMLGLSYGVFRNSRTCAVLLLCFFVINKLIMWSEAGNATGLPMALVFMWFYGQGILGTFQYHKLIRNGENAA